MDVSPLSRSEVSTSDPERAHQWLVDTYTDHRLQLSGDRAGFRMQVASQVTNLFRVDEVLHTMTVQADTEPFESLAIGRGRAGTYRMAGTHRAVTCGPGEVAVLNPFGPGRASWDGLEIQVTALDSWAARTIAAELSGVAPHRVRFELSAPLDLERARYWARTVDYVTRCVLGNAHAAAAPLMRAEALRSLAIAATVTFPNTALEAALDPTRAPEGSGEPSSVRRAVEFVDAHAGQDIGITDIAAAARISPRGLQAAFRRHRDQTPLEHLRRVRLERAHRDLQGADPSRGDTVSAIAARWGFTHPGRFSVAYRAAYGCSPSDTLRR